MRTLTLFIILMSLIGCQAGTHTILSSSGNGLTISYDAYGMVPTLTPEAELIAQKHCDTFLKNATYVGHRIPNIWDTKEWHDFECVEKPFTVEEVSFDVDQAIASSSTQKKLDKYLNCVRGNIILLDDLTSDALTISIAINQVCSSFHSEYVDEIISRINYSNEIENIIEDSFYDTSGSKIIPYVLNWRQIVRNGFSEDEQPTENELPNSLYVANVEISI